MDNNYKGRFSTSTKQSEVVIGRRLTPAESDLLAVPDHYYEYNEYLDVKPLNERAKKCVLKGIEHLLEGDNDGNNKM